MAKKLSKAAAKRRRRRRIRIRNTIWLLIVLALLVLIAYLWLTTPGSSGNNLVASLFATQQPAPTPTPDPTPVPEPTPDPTPMPTPVALEHDYYIVVDKASQVATVYTIGQDGTYSLEVRSMLVSTAKNQQYPEDGTYRLIGDRMEWSASISASNEYSRYAVRITDKIMFESVPYNDMKINEVNGEAYSKLGQNVTDGSVHLCLADAKWIYENVNAGTAIRFVSDGSESANRTDLTVPALGNTGWDPTEEDPKNPDFNPSYAKPQVTPWLGVTPAPTAAWESKNG